MKAMITMQKTTVILAGTLLLSACAEYGPAGDPRFGAAVQHNMALHIINPEPDDLTLPPTDGYRQGGAIGRYKTDTVEPPVETFTVDIDTNN
ncbi:MAG: hypothetical protein OEU92_14005 [Alphaproteobacteria bacterium]|nr:hypothetical protein [Alphaproteobacteria bacterium]